MHPWRPGSPVLYAESPLKKSSRYRRAVGLRRSGCGRHLVCGLVHGTGVGVEAEKSNVRRRRQPLSKWVGNNVVSTFMAAKSERR
ncbi:hypothetical protein DM02DRAFT_618531 [Periconia macrospinosa]|uniref:Uncharacterized protein n=1 Tax=Periconia macrospinosa TaxID=97972 RepID=A0A2V1D914_9PLEO|nr:hypothetical protein DM02DRAFT_618531 [Periconia macrospinosa]